MQKEIQISGSTYLLVEVDSIFYNFRIGKAAMNKGHLFASCAVTSGKKWELTDPGSWKIVGLAKDLSEQKWKKIVEGNEEYRNIWIYKDYTNGRALPTAIESGKSLLTHHGYEFSKTLILVKQ